MNIGEVLSRAWDIIWKNKILWLFGLLASLSGGVGDLNTRFNNRVNGGTISTPLPGLDRFFSGIPWWVFMMLLLAALVLIVIFVIIGALGRAGLVRGAWLADDGETGLNFRRLFQEGRTYFWRVLLLGILIFTASRSLIILLVIPTVMATVLTFGLALICLLPLICLLIPVFIAVDVIVQLAIVAITGENLGVMDGLRRAWDVFRSHLGEMIAMVVILVIGAAVVNFFFGLPLLLIMAPFISAALSPVGQIAAGQIAVSLFLFAMYLPVLLFVRGLVTSYIDSTWTLTYRRLTGRGPGSPAAAETPQPVV